MIDFGFSTGSSVKLRDQLSFPFGLEVLETESALKTVNPELFKELDNLS